MASRDGKQAIHDFSLHSLFGTALTFILALLTLRIVEYEESIVIIITLLFALISTALYFFRFI